MSFTLYKNRLQGVRQLDSPNQSCRGSGDQIELLIIHNISLPPGEFGTGCIDDFFCNRLDMDSHPYFRKIEDLQVSSHLLIDRHGMVTQYVPFDKKAWHAGESSFRGRSSCNDFSIGIELEGTDHEPFLPEQYETLVGVTNSLLLEYPYLNFARIVGHSDVAPGRKTDPGPFFDWEGYKNALDTMSNSREQSPTHGSWDLGLAGSIDVQPSNMTSYLSSG